MTHRAGDGSLAAAPGRFQVRLTRQIANLKATRYLFLLMLPGLAFYVIFRYVPIYGVTLAFKEFVAAQGILRSPWVGLKYFRRLFTYPGVLRVFLNTLKISGLRILFGFPAPLLLALLLNEVRTVAFKRTVQTISYLPHFLSWVVIAGLVRQILSPSTGLVGYLYSLFEKRPPLLLADPTWFVPILIISGVWQEIGWGTIVYLAAIAGINPELYEAAIMDGTGRFRLMWHITIPSIQGVIVILLILRVGHILEGGFDQIFNLYNSAVYDVADIIDTYVYRLGLESMQYSFATAVGLTKNLVGFALLLLTNRFSKVFSDSTLW
jgi:putative aldouronate transport system permease protein